MLGRRRNWSVVEDLIVYLSLIVIGAIPVGVALARHQGLGAEATIGIAMIVLGIAGLTYLAWAARHRVT